MRCELHRRHSRGSNHPAPNLAGGSTCFLCLLTCLRRIDLCDRRGRRWWTAPADIPQAHFPRKPFQSPRARAPLSVCGGNVKAGFEWLGACLALRLTRMCFLHAVEFARTFPHLPCYTCGRALGIRGSTLRMLRTQHIALGHWQIPER